MRHKGLLLTIAWMLTGIACYALAFPPWELGLLGWLAPLCWFRMLNGRSARQRFYLMFATGYAISGATLHWIWPLFSTLTLILMIIPSLYFAFWGLLMRLPFGGEWRIWHMAWPAVLWCGLEHLRGEWAPLSFSWIALGYSQQNRIGSWIAPIVGVYGLSALMILWAALVFGIWDRRPGLIRIPAALFLVVPLLIASFDRPWDTSSPVGSALLHQTTEYEDIAASPEVGRDGRSPEFVMWPEYSLFGDPFARENAWFLDMMKEEAAWAKHGALFGATDFATSESKRGAPYFNTIYMLDRNGSITAKAVKNKPIQLLQDGLPARDVTVATLPGTQANPYTNAPMKLGIGICYDGSFQQFARRMAAKGATVLCFPTCNMKAWGPIQHRQHQRMFQMRAAENRLPVLTAAANGPTFVADRVGAVRQELAFGKSGELWATIPRGGPTTVFTQGGWLIGPFCTITVGVVMLCAIATLIRNRRRGSGTESSRIVSDGR